MMVCVCYAGDHLRFHRPSADRRHAPATLCGTARAAPMSTLAKIMSSTFKATAAPADTGTVEISKANATIAGLIGTANKDVGALTLPLLP